jgi:hypothetical protein
MLVKYADGEEPLEDTVKGLPGAEDSAAEIAKVMLVSPRTVDRAIF